MDFSIAGTGWVCPDKGRMMASWEMPLVTPGAHVYYPLPDGVTVFPLSSVVPLVQMGETDANVAKFLNRYLTRSVRVPL